MSERLDFTASTRAAMLEDLAFSGRPLRLRVTLDGPAAELAPLVEVVVGAGRLISAAAGSIYGIAPTPERFANPHLRPRSPIPNLYFAGSEVTSVGVIGAMMGGILAVAAAEPRAALPYLARV